MDADVYEMQVAKLMPNFNLGPEYLGDKDYEVLHAHLSQWVRDNRKSFRSIPQAVRDYVHKVNGNSTSRKELLMAWDAHIAAIRATNLEDYGVRKQYQSKSLTYSHGGFQWV